MKKSIYLLAALSMVGANAFAKEVAVEPVQAVEAVVVQKVVEPWKFAGRIYLESEDFDNDAALRWQPEGGRISDDEDGTFWGTGVSATRGKLTLDLNVEKRFGGDTSFIDSDAEWEATRADWKVRYQLFEKQAFHIKYRNEERIRDYSKDTYHSDWTRDRFELGTDFNHFNGLLAGWLVAGYDKDEVSNPGLGASKEHGWYWEGDFGPSFKLTDRLSLNPTLYTTGEMYDSYEMVETQIRIMMPYQVTDKLTIMPRVRITLDRNQDSDVNGDFVRDWDFGFGDRIRYELLANYIINDQFSTFMGVAYEDATRDYKNADIIGGSEGKKDLDMIWAYVGLNYKFN